MVNFKGDIMDRLEIEWLITLKDITDENKYHITNCIRLEYLESKLKPNVGDILFASITHD